MNELSLFTGAGGGLLGTKLLGWNHIGYVENDDYCQRVIAQRIKDGILDEAPIFTDVREFLQSGAAREYRGFADVVTGGFPCQDISAAGRGAGITGEKSGLWKAMADIIREVRPRYAFVENSPILTSRGLDVVLGDLAEMGFDAEWGVLGAADVGAPHLRKRVWVMAHTDSGWELQPQGSQQDERGRSGNSRQDVANANRVNGRRRAGGQKRGEADNRSQTLADTSGERPPGPREQIKRCSQKKERERQTNSVKPISERQIWPTEPDVGRVANGVANRVDRLKAIGNGQVPRVAATAWRLLSD